MELWKQFLRQSSISITVPGIAVHGTETTGATEYTYTYTYGSTEPTEGPAGTNIS